MRQFFMNNDVAFNDLEERARHACIRFRDQEMPSGCNPNRGDVGFEVSGNPPTAKFLVGKGIQYQGPDPSLCDLFRTGEKQFMDFTSLKAWLQGPLREVFDTQSNTGSTPETHPSEAGGTSNLTDISTVHESIRDINKPLYLDETVLLNKLQQKVLGQEDALKGLAAVMVRHIARLRPARPAVVFEVGPSGVGKTRTAEEMPQIIKEFNDDDNGYQFLRLDMNEYQEAHRVSQLIGAPQGYVGHGEGSQLADVLRANPRTIVLFDEIEKAHPAILRVLMNAMDAGRLSAATSSSAGREIDCRHAVFIFTSNLDAKAILDELDSRSAFGNRSVEDEVCRRRLHAGGIAPEIVGRIGRFLVFRPLSPETRAEIMALSISEVAEEYGLKVTYVEPGVIIELMKKAKSQNFGVRPERFLIDDQLGSAFTSAAKQGFTNPVIVCGPPFECRLEEPSEDRADDTVDDLE